MKIGRYLCASALMAVVIYVLMLVGSSFQLMNQRGLMALQTGILIIIGAVIYFLIANFLGCEEARTILRVLSPQSEKGKK